jgi:hypothetical protein
MLPSLDAKPVILYRCRWRYGMSPGRTQPFDTAAVFRIAGYFPEIFENIRKTHFVHPIEQRTRIIEHTPRLGALFKQLRYEIAHALIALVENLGVMIVAAAQVIHHMLQIADYVGLFERLVGICYVWLMHMQRYRKCAFDVVPVNLALRQKNRVAVSGRSNKVLRAGYIRNIIYIRRQLSHFFLTLTNKPQQLSPSFCHYLVLSALLQPIHLLFAQSSLTSSILFYGVAGCCVVQ